MNSAHKPTMDTRFAVEFDIPTVVDSASTAPRPNSSPNLIEPSPSANRHSELALLS